MSAEAACDHPDKRKVAGTIYHWCPHCGALGMTLIAHYDENNKPLPKGTHRDVWYWEHPKKKEAK